MKNLDERLGKLVNKLDQVTGMLIVASRTDATVKNAKNIVVKVSLALDDIINEIQIMEVGRPITNYDLIRNMSIEEMAVALMCPNEMGMAEIECDHSDSKNCCQCLLDWLKEETK